MSEVPPPPNLVTIPYTYDTMLQKNYLREFAESRYPQVELIRLNREDTVVDELYLESTVKRFHEPLKIFCLPEHEPNKKTLTKYGLEQSRPVLFKVATLHLADAGYLKNDDTWMIGDLIRWGGDIYEVKDQVKDKEAYWALTNIPMFFVLGADFYRVGI